METKRSRWEPANPEAAASTDQGGQPAKRAKTGENGETTAVKKPLIDMSVIEKAKAALQKQKELKEKLEKLKQAKAAAAQGGAQPKPAAAQGGGVSLLVELEKARLEVPGRDAAHFDPMLHSRNIGRRSRPALHFVEAGTFQKEADMVRLKAQFGEGYVRDLEQRRQREAQEAEGADFDANLVPLGTRAQTSMDTNVTDKKPVVPDVEWWDAKILIDKTSYEGGEIREDKITHYVEHPVLLEPPAEAPPPPPQPLKLTKKEIKKLRTQRRIARENEKQDLIRQGLLEPPKPKVKISNLMRVLGAEATADPTAIEAEVRRQMAERAAAHEDRNLARQLTPAERREKKLKKLLDPAPGSGAGAEVTHVAVYKVGDLSSPQLRFKVEVNAKENHMTGIALCVSGKFSVVIVEGGPKTQRRYEKLMLRRIQWDKVPQMGNGRDDDTVMQDARGEGGEGGGVAMINSAEKGEEVGVGVKGGSNYCQLVWTGIVKEPAFGRSKFKLEEVRNEAAARQFLAERGVEHYWDLAVAVST